MSHRLSFLRPSPAIVVAVASLLAACGGLAFAATTSSTSIIRACANKRSGILRIARKCHRNERRVTWSQIGPRGLHGLEGPRGHAGATGSTGATGARGLQGKEGKEGPQGPGAISFDTTITGEVTLAGPIDGIVVKALCSDIKKQVAVVVGTASNLNNLQASGTASEGPTTLAQVDSTTGSSIDKLSALPVDLDVVAADRTIGKVVRADIHGEYNEPSCPVWGMVIPPG